ncbi:hypothetical protein PQO01_16210 [Lentisphaera marina]|uniref:hypothetical protein n=1 Tax=Lentisphaera marina TaxID=1111041 RepID=UPI0023651F7E|nr:hypothetical protein [Lentisphaera marina]MDD7986495.1 hypothetical protein [Lentisphaera marina]
MYFISCTFLHMKGHLPKNYKNTFSRIKKLIYQNQKSKIKNQKDLVNYTVKVIETINDEISRTRLTEPFWNEQRKKGGITHPKSPKTEPNIQPTLYWRILSLISGTGIHCCREPSIGSGDLDFQFSYTTKSSKDLFLPVEFKLAHGNIDHGIETQLPI